MMVDKSQTVFCLQSQFLFKLFDQVYFHCRLPSRPNHLPHVNIMYLLRTIKVLFYLTKEVADFDFNET